MKDKLLSLLFASIFALGVIALGGAAAAVFEQVRKNNCSMVSGLDIENTPPGASIKRHMHGPIFWQFEICKGKPMFYKGKNVYMEDK